MLWTARLDHPRMGKSSCRQGAFLVVADHPTVHTNTVEGFFSILKRGIMGVYHNVSRRHLHRYLSEFEFRYNTRQIEDGERTARAIQGAVGKRLTYREPAAG